MNIWEKLGGRKFVAFIIIIVGGVLLHVFSSKGVTTEVTALLLGALGTFSASNALVTRAHANTSEEAEEEEVTSPPAPVQVEPDPRVEQLVQQVGELQAASMQTLSSVSIIQDLLSKALGAKK